MLLPDRGAKLTDTAVILGDVPDLFLQRSRGEDRRDVFIGGEGPLSEKKENTEMLSLVVKSMMIKKKRCW